jgi:CubicO group peptidase (beta-lactamase class C family)
MGQVYILSMDLAALTHRHREESSVPALAAAVVRSGGIETAVAGLRRLGSEEPAEAGDRFHVGSNAKAMTATVAALLVERGAIGWDSPAGDVLGIPEADPHVTLERLLRHAAGIRPLEEDDEVDALALPAGAPAEERLAAVRILLAEPTRALDGAGDRRYSNGGYTIAGAMLEHAADRAFEELVTAELFQALGLDAGFGWPAAGGARQPWGHFDDDGGLRPHDPDDGYRLGAVLAPAGDVSASIASYGEFVRLHLRGLRGEAPLLSAESFARLHSADDEGFALGWGVQDFEGARSSVHSGSADTFYAVVVLQPDHDLAVAVLANAAGERAAGGVVALTHELVREAR